jgi:hypothetical protein
VGFKEAADLATRLGLFGVVETSAKSDSFTRSIEDSFYMVACQSMD